MVNKKSDIFVLLLVIQLFLVLLLGFMLKHERQLSVEMKRINGVLSGVVASDGALKQKQESLISELKKESGSVSNTCSMLRDEIRKLKKQLSSS